LAHGLLSSNYLHGIPEGSRAAATKSLSPEVLNDDAILRLRGLNELAKTRGQTLSQMAIAYVLRDARMTSALVGASRPEQIVNSVGALGNLGFSPDELAHIDRLAFESEDW
jgi:L-glyceraldehyde 3-phosphate reductase